MRLDGQVPSPLAGLDEALDAILDAPAPLRAAMLAAEGATDPARGERLRRLVEDCERDAPFLDRPVTERFDELLDEVPFVPPELLGGRYRTVRELARGGMARVFLAHDIKHSRDVAVKIIRPELAATLGRDPFLREITIAARLRHPNIVPLYDSGDETGALYFVMPFEDGPSLRDVLRDGPMPIRDAIRTLRDVARALAYAHDHGVVHRDVKPDNVLMSGGTAVVADFGIATALDAARAGDAIETQARTSGTPAYMSPEQVRGDRKTDRRADLYSFGCLAYELFSGSPPFGDLPTSAQLDAHADLEPVAVGTRRQDLPPLVARLVMRCLEKDPSARPQSAAEILEVLDGSSGESRFAHPRRLIVAAALVFFALGFAGWRLVTRSPNTPGTVPLTVAVLPFRSLVGDSSTYLLASGLTNEIATALSNVRWVQVISRGGAGNYRDREIDPRVAGRDLGARFLLSGTAFERNGHLISTMTLVNASDGSVRWTGRFDEVHADMEKMPEEVARQVGDALRALAGTVASSTDFESPTHRPTGDAYFYQMQAQEWLDRRGQSVRTSAEYFRKAIEEDQDYARAYSGLSLALALYPYFQNTRAAEVHRELVDAAQSAIRLDSTLAQPHSALGMAYQHRLQWHRAEAEFLTAIRLDGRDVEARVQYGRHLLMRGRTTDAAAQFQAARDNDPASALVLSWVSYTWSLLGRPDSARAISERALRNNPQNFTAIVLGSLVRLQNRDRAGALALIKGGPKDFPVTEYVLASTTDEQTARRHLDAVVARALAPWMLQTTVAYGMLGLKDTTRALEALERATAEGEIWSSLQPTADPLFDGIRRSERFAALLRKAGLAAM